MTGTTMSQAAGTTDMPPMPLVMGSIADCVVMGTVVSELVHDARSAAFDNDAWVDGASVGVARRVIVGAVFMPKMPSTHPRTRDGWVA